MAYVLLNDLYQLLTKLRPYLPSVAVEGLL
jgi:hypothetical protein